MSEDNFLPLYIVLGILFLIGLIVIILVIGTYYQNKCAGNNGPKICCDNSAAQNNVVTIVQEPAARRNYAVLEDHLHLVDTPEHSIETNLRPITAAALAPRKQIVERPGLSLEFLPEDNTVILIESTSSKITKITKTQISLEERLRKTGPNSASCLFKGHLGGPDTPICVHVIKLGGFAFEKAKRDIMHKDRDVLDAGSKHLTPHPRYIRYLGTCFNAAKSEVYVITDFVAGCAVQEIWKNPEIRGLMELSETERVQAASDVAEAVYFLHGHSKPLVHGGIALNSMIIDGETHRAKLMSKEAMDRIEELIGYTTQDEFSDPLTKSSVTTTNNSLQETSPELLLEQKSAADLKCDIWSLGATVLQFLFDQSVWDMHSITKQFNVKNHTLALQQAVSMSMEASILSSVRTANPKLQFLIDCLNYNPLDRPTATYISRGLQQCVKEIQRDSSSPLNQISSYLFPGRRIFNSAKTRTFDPLIRQQIEWNVKQDSGHKKRALLFGTRNYLDKNFKSLSVTPVNDIKDMTTVLQLGGFGLGNTYENIKSRQQFEDILKAYVDAVNKEPEDVELLVLYYSGQGVQGLPKKLSQKQRLGIFLDRVGISHDLALVTGNETLFPVAKLQTILAGLNARVKRKVVILDCRISKRKRGKLSPLDPFSTTQTSLSGQSEARTFNNSDKNNQAFDWDVPVISEESLDKLTTMFTIYPSIEDGVGLASVDSHPRRTNGFLTGCLLNVLKDYSRPAIEDLPRILNDEMCLESSKMSAFRGIECKADFIPVDSDIWMVPFLTGG